MLVETGNSQPLAGKIINYAKQYQWDNIAEQIQEIYNKI
jgi:hypothetical protein